MARMWTPKGVLVIHPGGRKDGKGTFSWVYYPGSRTDLSRTSKTCKHGLQRPEGYIKNDVYLGIAAEASTQPHSSEHYFEANIIISDHAHYKSTKPLKTSCRYGRECRDLKNTAHSLQFSHGGTSYLHEIIPLSRALHYCDLHHVILKATLI